jgi:Cu/Ag efflux pump CusA
MRWVIGSSQRYRLIVTGVTAAVMFLAVMQLRDARIDVLPEFSATVVQVQTEALGLSSAEVERMITTPLEKDMFSGIAFLDEIHSESITSLSSVVLVFEPGTDVMDARQLVQERLALAPGLPNVSKTPEMLQPLSSSNRVLMVELSSPSLTQMELSVLARWRIAPRLMGVQGVANVAVWANRDRQLQVQVDPVRLKANDVTLQQVVETTANALWFSPLTFVEASVPGTGGFIDSPNQRLPIQHVLPIRTAKDLADVAVEGTGNASLRLGDVADVVEEHQPLIGDAVVGGDDPGVTLVVEKLPGASVLDVTEGVETVLAEMRLGLPGVDADTTAFRPATFVEAALDNLSLAFLLGGLLLIIVIGVVFASWRAALVALVSIFTAVLTAGLVLHVRGATFNAVLLVGLVMALVVIVDEAVVSVHSAQRHLRRGADEEPATLVEAGLAVRGPLVLATLIVAATAAPLLFLGGGTGAFYRELATAYLVAVVAAMAVALTVTPALSALLLSGRTTGRADPLLVRSVRRVYEAALGRVVQRSGLAFSGVAVIVVAGLAALPGLASPTLLPSMRDRDLLVDWTAAPGTSHPEMMRVTANAVDELRAIPGVRRVGALVGRAVSSDRTTEIDSAQLWLNIAPTADYGATTDAVQEVVSAYPGIAADASTYPDRLVQATESVTDELVVRIYGDDLDVLRDKADEVRRAIATVDGVSSPRIDLPAQAPTLQIKVDLLAAERTGVKPGDVRRAAATLVQGLEVGNLFEEQKVFDVLVVGVPELRNSVTDILDLKVDKPRRGHVRLGDVARVRVAPIPSVLRHEATSRYVDVTAGVSSRDPGAVVQDVRTRIKQIEFPFEHHAEVRDDPARGSTNTTRALLYGLAAAVAVFLLLQAALVSWRLTSVLFWVLPAAAAGGLIALALAEERATIGSIAGLLAVVGVTGRWLVLHVRHIGRLQQESGTHAPELVVRAAGERLAPIALTALGVAAALLPLFLMGAVPGLEVVRPLAVTLFGGLVTATALMVFVVPTLCAHYGASHVDVGLVGPGGRQIEGQARHV